MSRLLLRLISLLLIPCITLCSNVPLAPTLTYPSNDLFNIPFTFDEVNGLLDEIENDKLEKLYTHEEIVEIVHFLISLSRIGVLPGESSEALEADIQELLSSLEEDIALAPPMAPDYMFAPSFYGQVFLCKKGFVHRCTDHAKHFVSKNKKVILISVAVVAAIVVTAGVATAVAGAASVAAAAAEVSTPSHHEEAIPLPTPLQEAVKEQVSALIEVADEMPLPIPKTPSFAEAVRDLGSSLAHKALDGVGEIVGVVPAALESVENVARISSTLLPACLQDSKSNPLRNGKPTENFEKALAHGHQTIDQIFSTDQAPRYTQEAKESKFKIIEAILPPPWVPGNPPTPASSVKGWKVGEDITNLTRVGNTPSWDAVRARIWKEKAMASPEKYEADQLERMRRGLAPQRTNPKTGEIESMELHHNPAQKDGGLFDVVEVWPDEHSALDPKRFAGR